MATKDITDRQVCEACAEMWRRARNGESVDGIDEVLMAHTGQPWKVCRRAIERAVRRDLLDYGVHPGRAFLTPSGEAFLAQQSVNA